MSCASSPHPHPLRPCALSLSNTAPHLPPVPSPHHPQLASEGKKHGFDAKAADLEDFEEADMLETKRGIFVMATYGEGEATGPWGGLESE